MNRSQASSALPQEGSGSRHERLSSTACQFVDKGRSNHGCILPTHGAISARAGCASLVIAAAAMAASRRHCRPKTAIAAGPSRAARTGQPGAALERRRRRGLQADPGFVPLAQTRTFSIMHAAIHDALNAIERRYAAVHTGPARGAPRVSGSRRGGRGAAGARCNCIPEQAALVETAYGSALSTVRDGAGQDHGHRHRTGCGPATLARRQADGADHCHPACLRASARCPANTSSPRPSTSPTCRVGAACSPSPSSCRNTHSKARRQLTSPAVRARLRASQGDRAEHEQHPHCRTNGDRQVLVRGLAVAVEPYRQHGGEEAGPRCLGYRARVHAGELRDGRRLHRRLRREVPLSHLAAGHRDPGRGNAMATRVTETDASWQPLLVTPPVPDYPSTHTVLGWAAAEVLGEHLWQRRALRGPPASRCRA